MNTPRTFAIVAGSVFAVALGLSAVLAGLPVTPKAPVEPVSGQGESYRWDGTLTFRPPVATNGRGEFLPGHPLLQDAGQVPNVVERLLGGGGAEPTIGSTSHGNLFVVVADTVRRSTDAGRTWEIVYDFTTPNFPTTVDRFANVDPILWVDPDTDRVFVGHMTADAVVGLPFCFALAHSDDEGRTWASSRVLGLACDTPYAFDHPKLVTAKPGPRAVLPLLGPYPNVVYLCTNKYVSTHCAASLDGGDNWAYTRTVRVPEPADLTQFGNLNEVLGIHACPGINGPMAAYPDGTVVVPVCTSSWNEVYEPIVGVTEDNGLTWEVRQFDGKVGQVEIDPDITITPDGTAYFFFRGDDQLAYLLRSPDKFRTWQGPFRVSPVDHTLNAFTAMTSGDDGRIALAYLGTRDNQKDPREEAFPDGERSRPEPSYAYPGTHWHLFVSVSLDAGADAPTFVTTQVTPEEDPVQVGCIWYYGGISECRNLLDFIDLTHDPEGRLYVALTDGCTTREGCSTDPASATFQSHDREVAVAVQNAGWSLFAEHGILPSLGLEPPYPFPR